MSHPFRTFCLLVLAAALLGAPAASPCGAAAPGTTGILAAPCCPAGGTGAGTEPADGACSCPCDPAPAALAEPPPRPPVRVTRLREAAARAPSSPRHAPGHPVPIA